MNELNLDPKTTALILIDLENGIVDGNLAPYAGGDVVGRCAHLAEAVRNAGGAVVYVRVEIGEILALPADKPSRDPHAPPPPPEASRLVAGCGYQDGDLLIVKRQRGAFYGTPLDQLLRRRNIQTLIMGGIATNLGVESTARAAFDRGYALIFAEDAMTTSLSPEAHHFAVETIFPTMGRVRTSDEIKEALVS